MYWCKYMNSDDGTEFCPGFQNTTLSKCHRDPESCRRYGVNEAHEISQAAERGLAPVEILILGAVFSMVVSAAIGVYMVSLPIG